MSSKRDLRNLYKAVQAEFPHLTVEQIQAMVSDAYEMAQNHISSGSLTPIYFQYLGRFKVSEGRRKWLEEHRKKNDNIEQQLHTGAIREDGSEESGISDILEAGEA